MTAPAFRIDDRLVDREAFYAVACDPARSCAVEACAGSGKTWMLVSRMLRALLEGAAPHEILAITFTRAAAGEMRERLVGWLARYSAARSTHEERIEALRQRGLSAQRAAALAPALAGLYGRVLAAGRPVEIRTFHAWFSQLLRAAPLVLLDRLGLAPDLELLEDIDEHKPAVLRAFQTAVLRDPGLGADYAALTARRGRTQLRRWLEAAWDKRIEFELADEAGVLEESVEPASATWPDLARFDHPVDATLDVFWQTRLHHVVEVLDRGSKTGRAAAAALAQALETGDPRRCFDQAWRALYTQDDKPRVLGKAAALADTQAALGLLATQVHQEDSRLEHLRMVRLVRALLVAFANYKRARGYADMGDLERCALALLRDSELAGWVQERLDARVRHLLIDEFQDTNPLQWQALQAWLAGYAGAGGGASGQRPPGVFIVGDPKQSIYRFRGAEPRVFAAATRFVREGLDGSVLTCDHTRRNAPGIVAAINALFGRAETEGDFSGFRPHTTEVPIEAGGALEALPRVNRDARKEKSPDQVVPAWRDSLTEPRLEPEIVLRAREAAAVAGAVGVSLDGGAAPEQVFVLCRKRETLRLVATDLERAHIAHSAVEDTSLAATTEAQDLIAVLDAIVSPQHRLSLARALRSPLFGASDADLLALSAAALGAGDRDWWRALMAMREPAPALARAARLLRRWRAAAATLPPHDLLDRIIHEGELRERTVAVVPPEQRALALDAIDAVLAQALILDGGRYATPYGFVRALKRRIVKSSPPLRAGALRLLTIHGAKGLEADCVFVADSDPEPPGTVTTTLLVAWPLESARPTRCAFVYSESRCPPSLRDALDDTLRERRREELNGLYVAMTRARHRLVFSATEPYQRGSGPSWWQRIEPVAVAVPAPDATARVGSIARIGAVRAAVLKTLPPLVRAATPSMRSTTSPIAQGAAPVQADLFAMPMALELEDGTPSGDAEAATLGRAVHRLLEWAMSGTGEARLEALAAAAAREFGAEASAVLRHGRAMLGRPEAARFFRGAELRWSGNEVAIADGGEVLRIDRLVQLDSAEGFAWWVLDYKLSHAPENLAPYRRQLQRYRDAVRALQPGDTVRCAFITGEGRVVEVD
jgi:ATP-dependent helicase/nuclease subunit A